MGECLFCDIANGELATPFVLESDEVVVFKDISPQSPVHLVAIPRAHYENVAELSDGDQSLSGNLLKLLTKSGEAEGLTAEAGYRVVFNTGPDGGQSVFHVHAHLLGGRAFEWPPG